MFILVCLIKRLAFKKLQYLRSNYFVFLTKCPMTKVYLIFYLIILFEKKLTNEVQKWLFICAKFKNLRGKLLVKMSLDVSIE